MPISCARVADDVLRMQALREVDPDGFTRVLNRYVPVRLVGVGVPTPLTVTDVGGGRTASNVCRLE